MNKYEYFKIVNPYLKNTEVQEMREISHHLTNRLSHCMKVSYLSFLICKKANWDYKSVAKAALLHDFYLGKIKNEKGLKNKLYEFSNGHPEEAYRNTLELFGISPIEENIIFLIM